MKHHVYNNIAVIHDTYISKSFKSLVKQYNKYHSESYILTATFSYLPELACGPQRYSS